MQQQMQQHKLKMQQKEVAADVKNAAIDAKDSAANKMAETKEAVADKLLNERCCCK